MARLLIWICPFLVALFICPALLAADAKVRKVLPSLLDQEGRASLHPSLYERDAYQSHLRHKPSLVGGMRFDVNWTAPRSGNGPLELRLELRGSAVGTNVAPAGANGTNSAVVTTPVTAPRFGARWTRITLEKSVLQQVGNVTAWRATLRRDGTELASSQSFMW